MPKATQLISGRARTRSSILLYSLVLFPLYQTPLSWLSLHLFTYLGNIYQVPLGAGLWRYSGSFGPPAWVGLEVESRKVTWRHGVRRLSFPQGEEQAQWLTWMWMFPQVIAGVMGGETGCEPCRGKILGQWEGVTRRVKDDGTVDKMNFREGNAEWWWGIGHAEQGRLCPTTWTWGR